MIRIEKIVYPTDFSSYSNQAYFHAVALAATHNATLSIVLVHTPELEKSVPASHKGESREYWLRQLKQIHPVDSSIPVDHHLLEGDPASEIVRFANNAHADLIVMGTHGRTGVERVLMGSVAEKVMHDAPCSVLVVKLPRKSPLEPEDRPILTGRSRT